MKRFIVLVLMMLLVTPCYAHSGRLDGNGGHRVNKPYEYTGVYYVIKDGEKQVKKGTLYFKEGEYHYHVQPTLNGYKDGIYIPVQQMNKTITNTIYKSEENRVSSKESNIYHKSDCRYIKRIKEENIVIFEDPEDAESNGYIPCKHCNPEVIE